MGGRCFWLKFDWDLKAIIGFKDMKEEIFSSDLAQILEPLVWARRKKAGSKFSWVLKANSGAKPWVKI